MKKFKSANVKKLAIGTLLALSAAQSAQATIPVVATSDLYLSVWDPTGLQSYTIDLGETLNYFYTHDKSTVTFNATIAPEVTGFLSWATTALTAGHTLTYNVGASDVEKFNSNTALPTPDAVLFSMDTTRQAQFTPIGSITNNGIANAQFGINNFLGLVNTVGTSLVYSSSPAYFNYNPGTGIPYGIGQGIANSDD